MKERPILFSAPMVIALLNGSKTQTRRLVKPQPRPGAVISPRDGDFLVENWPRQEREFSNFGRCEELECPHGRVGDHLWCKETHKITVQDRVIYRADSPVTKADEVDRAFGPWKPSIFMRREYSRITLEITGVRVERLQEISRGDAIAEGVSIQMDAKIASEFIRGEQSPAQLEYWALWESINGRGSWALNPWVWVLTFRRVQP